MASMLPGEASHHGIYEGGPYKISLEKPEDGGRWYFSRKEIEDGSPARLDGIDMKKETYLRKSYCTFLQDLGMRLKVPQTIATVCMFLAGKVEETPRPLKDVILVSYEIINKKDPAAVQRIKQKEVYEQQKELILLGERVVLATLGFDLNVHHPYKPLVEAIKKFKVAQNALAQVAWNFVNDGLRTSLCLQFKPHHIAAGAIFLAAKFLKVKLPSDGEKVWWQEFDVTPRQLEEVSNQMLELYEQNRVPPPSQTSEAEGSAGAAVGHRPPSKATTGNDEHAPINSMAQSGVNTSKPATLKPASSRSAEDHTYSDNRGGHSKTTQNRSNDYGSSAEIKSVSDQKVDGEVHESEELQYQENIEEVQNRCGDDDQARNGGRAETREAGEVKDKYHGYRDGGTVGQSPQEAIKKIDKDKVKAALEKRRKARGDTTRKTDLMDEDDLIERELEDGIELTADTEKVKQDRRTNWSKPSKLPDHEKGQLSRGQDSQNVEEGEVAALDDVGHGYRSPKSINRKRKAGSPPDRPTEGRQRSDYARGSHHHSHHDLADDRNRLARLGYTERDKKRHVQENHV